MIPFVLVNTRPVPGSTLDSDNPWHDKASRYSLGRIPECLAVIFVNGILPDKRFTTSTG